MRFEDAKLGQHFHRREFVCPCGCNRAGVDWQLIQQLDALRNHTKKPVIVTPNGGYRCQAQQMRTNFKAPNSYHQTGQAADHHVLGVPIEDVYEWWLANHPNNGLGFYPDNGFIHSDTRGYAARWAA